LTILQLPYKKAISLNEEIPTSGNSPIKVIADDYEVYVAKNSRNKNPAYDIINEVIAYILLMSWEIPVPDCAIMEIDPQMLLPEYSKNNHKPSFYQNPVFASKWINANDGNLFFEIHSRKDYKKFLNPEIIFKIGLFDIWVENDDRKPSNNNILLQVINGFTKIVAIDHSYIFSTMNYEDLNPDDFYPIYNDNILMTNFAKSIKPFKKKKQKWFKFDEQDFYLCIENSKQNFKNILNNIPQSWGFTQNHYNNLYNFLFNEERNRKVILDYFDKMN
jgi:hypothetical protein